MVGIVQNMAGNEAKSNDVKSRIRQEPYNAWLTPHHIRHYQGIIHRLTGAGGLTC